VTYYDRVRICVDCANEFVYTAGEQAYFAERGIQGEPTHCKPCQTQERRIQDTSQGSDQLCRMQEGNNDSIHSVSR